MHLYKFVNLSVHNYYAIAELLLVFAGVIWVSITFRFWWILLWHYRNT